jgi:hypothetical protein
MAAAAAITSARKGFQLADGANAQCRNCRDNSIFGHLQTPANDAVGAFVTSLLTSVFHGWHIPNAVLVKKYGLQ